MKRPIITQQERFIIHNCEDSLTAQRVLLFIAKLKLLREMERYFEKFEKRIEKAKAKRL